MSVDPALISCTPPGLEYSDFWHQYVLCGVPLVHVTGLLTAVGLIDTRFFSDVDRTRGALVHAAIALLHDAPTEPRELPDGLAQYVDAYRRFLTDTGFVIDACEERLANLSLRCAGTLDLRGRFPASPVTHVIDVKTGSVPSWVGVQTAGYACLLPQPFRHCCRRYCLQLRGNRTYALIPLRKESDERVFLGALTVALHREGWL